MILFFKFAENFESLRRTDFVIDDVYTFDEVAVVVALFLNIL